MRLPLTICLALSLAACASSSEPVSSGDTPSQYAAALADPQRPQADRDRDSARRPADILAFARIEPGEKVGDYIMGGGYWTRILSNAVGPTGKVYAAHLAEADEAEHNATPPAGSKPLADHPNVIAAVTRANTFALPAKADVIWMRQNYHDLYDKFMGPSDVPAFNKAVYKALKPGGRFVIIDHSAPDGTGLRDVETKHRIDAAVVKADLAAAGFRFVGESNVLRNPADDRSKLVFDPSVRGKTDQFVYVFQRP